jgi:hypothetical protein
MSCPVVAVSVAVIRPVLNDAVALNVAFMCPCHVAVAASVAVTCPVLPAVAKCSCSMSFSCCYKCRYYMSCPVAVAAV